MRSKATSLLVAITVGMVGFQNCSEPFSVAPELNSFELMHRESVLLSQTAVAFESLPDEVVASDQLNIVMVPPGGVKRDDVSYECSLDDSEYKSCVSPTVLEGLSEGVHKFKARAIHRTGVVSLEGSFAWIVDTQPPEINFFRKPPILTGNTTARFDLNVADQSSRVTDSRCSLNGTDLTSCEGRLVFEGLTAGTHIFEISAKDQVGNTSSESFNWSVDLVTPWVEFLSSPEPYQRESTALYRFQMSAVGSEVVAFQCRFSSADFVDCVSPFIQNSLPQGHYEFAVRGRTADGDFSPELVSRFTVDTEAPTITVARQPPPLTGAGRSLFEIEATDQISGLKSLVYQLNGDDPKQVTPALRFDLPSGSHELVFTAEDYSGLKSSKAVQWTIDLESAWFSVEQGERGGLLLAQDTITMTPSAVGSEIDGYLCRLDGGSEFICNPPVSLKSLPQPLTDGPHSLSIKARTALGETSTPQTVSFSVDAVPPVVTLGSVPPSSRQSFNISFTAIDSPGPQLNSIASGIDRIECAIAGEPPRVCNSPFQIRATQNGMHSVTIRAFDRGGNYTEVVARQEIVGIVPDGLPFLTINPWGGAMFAGNIVPLSAGGTMLSSYDQLGQGSLAEATPNVVSAYGAKWFRNSGLLSGLNAVLAPSDAGKVRVYAVAVENSDDSSANPFDLSHAVRKAGRTGALVKGLVTRPVSDQMPSGIFAQPAFTPAEPFATYFSRLEDLSTAVPRINNYDPRLNTSVSAIYNLNPTTPTNSLNLILAALTQNVLNDNVDIASGGLGGFDYHGVPRTSSNAKDQELGLAVGRAAKVAISMSTPLFIYVPTDGAAIGRGSNDSWIGDNGGAGVILFFVVDPNELLPSQRSDNDYFIGSFDINSQRVMNSHWENSVQADARAMAATAVLANYLVVSGKADKIEELTEGRIESARDLRYIRITSALPRPPK